MTEAMIEATAARRPTLPIVIVGHVDHGKSTLIGRLLKDTGALAEGQEKALRETCRRRGVPFEWSFLLDALQAERNQGVTIDTTEIRFRTPERDYVIIDAPGHKEFLKNMVSGAAAADAAVLVVDAAEGVLEQSRRHAFLLHLLGVQQVAVAVNKIDLVGHDRDCFEKVARDIGDYLDGIGVHPSAVIPVSARDGDNVGRRSGAMPWYDGPTVIEALDDFANARPLGDRPLRFPVQDVYKFDRRRLIAGRIESGRLRVGDELVFTPGGKRARVASIEAWSVPAPRICAVAGESVAITLDQEIFVERGAVAAHPADAPAPIHFLSARLFWLGKTSLAVGGAYGLKLGTASYRVTVAAIDRIIDVSDLSSGPGDEVPRNGIAEVVLHSRAPIVADPFNKLPRTGRGVLVDGYDVVGGLIASGPAETAHGADAPVSRNLTAVEHAVTRHARARANRHEGGVIWLTGLSGAGKSTLAMALEKTLFSRGAQSYVLDGDNLRRGLTADLGFSPQDRRENIRRVGEVARLFAEAGFIVITALISPYREDRDRARAAAGELFHEIHVKADIATCEARDPKGLYAKARAGEIEEFTGVSAPYEPPLDPALVLDTAARSEEECLEALLAYVDRAFFLQPHTATTAA